MLFLFKYIDDLIGKGFEWYIILELLMYAAATNVALSLPLAILLSSIMTFGSMGENYELVAIKSAGISLQKAMYPLIITITFLSIGAFLFSDYMLPVANLKMGSLLYDVRNQKAAFLIENGVFNSSIPGYSIRVDNKEDDGNVLKGITIYDHTSGNGNSNILIAKEGEMSKTDDGNFLLLKLKDGIRYEESQGSAGYNPRQRLIRSRFKETEQKFDLSSFAFKREDENLFKQNYQMLNIKQLKFYEDSIRKARDSVGNNIFLQSSPYLKIFNTTKDFSKYKPKKDVSKNKMILSDLSTTSKNGAVSTALESIRSIKEVTDRKIQSRADFNKIIRRYIIEYNRKFTLSISCLVLFLIGAPLGAIIRKGGLGLPVVMSVLFFLIYHIISTMGEKFAKEGQISPQLGMWMAILILTPVGFFLTYKATIDSVLFDIDAYKKFFQKIFKKQETA